LEHEYGLHKNASAIATWLKSQTRPLVVTLHTVPIPGHEQAQSLDWFPRCLTSLRVHAIAHQQRGVDALRAYGVRNAHCIPHGSCGPYAFADVVRRVTSRERLSLPVSGVIGATVGFWTPGKRNEMTVEALVRLLQRGKLPTGFTFVIAGQPMGKESERAMRNAAANLERAGLAETIRIRPGFVDDALMADYYAAIDFAVSNSGPTMYSITGRGHLAMAYGCPVLAADVPLQEEFRKCGMVFSTLAALEDGITKLANDDGLRAELRDKSRAYAEHTSWARVAEMHEAVYEEASA
jgi:glycosyltransferase involved in cell wall biosynthesis